MEEHTRAVRCAAVVTSLALAPAALGVSYGPDEKVIGINVGGLDPLTTEWAFTDLMKGATVWDQVGAGSIPLDSRGNPVLQPGQAAQTNVRLPLFGGPHYEPGTYTVSWEGGGQFFVSNPSSGTRFFGSQNQNGGSGTITFSDPRDHIYVQVQSQNQNNRLRNIQLRAPGYSSNEHFSDEFTASLGGFDVVRYMPWMRPNDTTVSSWSQRNRVSDNQWTDSTGVPVERLVELANLGQFDPWFTMPTRADDNYVRQFSTYVRDNLDPDLTAYVEYGNEAWNPDFAGRPYLEQRAAQTGKGSQNWAVQWAEEADADFDVWTDVFSGQGDRFKRVAAAQGPNRFHSPIFLRELEARGGFDVLSMAAYIGVPQSSYNASTTADDILDDLMDDIAENADETLQTYFPGTSFELTAPRGDWAWHRDLADQYKAELIAYEGGQHVTTGGDPNVPWFGAYVAAQRDERMFFVYQELLETYLRDVGADGFLQFVTTGPINQFGSWGAREFQTQSLDDSPKMRALLAELTIPEPAAAGTLALAAGCLLRRRRGD